MKLKNWPELSYNIINYKLPCILLYLLSSRESLALVYKLCYDMIYDHSLIVPITVITVICNMSIVCEF